MFNLQRLAFAYVDGNPHVDSGRVAILFQQQISDEMIT